MSNITIQPNASGTGTFSIASPNSNTSRTLTLPDTTGVLLNDASSLASGKLTGALPAIDGSALTGVGGPISSGSMASTTYLQFTSLDTDTYNYNIKMQGMGINSASSGLIQIRAQVSPDNFSTVPNVGYASMGLTDSGVVRNLNANGGGNYIDLCRYYQWDPTNLSQNGTVSSCNIQISNTGSASSTPTTSPYGNPTIAFQFYAGGYESGTKNSLAIYNGLASPMATAFTKASTINAIRLYFPGTNSPPTTNWNPIGKWQIYREAKS
ncbi:hypothetical protein N9155_00085 [bacterium]|nr:hypothetical protein [bacterium]